MMASKIKLEERPSHMNKLKMSPNPNDASKMSNIYSTNSSNVSSLYKVVPAPKHIKWRKLILYFIKQLLVRLEKMTNLKFRLYSS